MRRNGFDGHWGHFALSLPHLLHSHSVPPRNTIPLRFLFSLRPRLPVCRAKRVFEHRRIDFELRWFVYLYRALAKIKSLFAGRFLCVFPLCCYLYSRSAEKEPFALTQKENMPSSHFCIFSRSFLHTNAVPLCNRCCTVFFKQDFICLCTSGCKICILFLAWKSCRDRSLVLFFLYAKL